MKAKPQLISLEEGVGKMKAALDGRGDPSLVVMGRTGTRAAAHHSISTTALRAPGPMRLPASMRCSSPASGPARARGDFGGDDAADRARGPPERDDRWDYLTRQRVRIALQGHAPFAAATQAVYETLKALREGTSPKNLKGLASSELIGRLTREADVKARGDRFSRTKR